MVHRWSSEFKMVMNHVPCTMNHELTPFKLSYPMPHAGHPSGVLLVLGFSVAGFLPPSTVGFSHELMTPAVTATSIAWSNVFEIFIVFDYEVIEIVFFR
jgi:hypothetical protein